MEISEITKKLKFRIPRAVFIGAGIFVVIIGGFCVAVLVQAESYKDRVLPGVEILGVQLGNLTKSEAKDAIDKKTSQILDQGFIFKAGDKETTLTASTHSPEDPDLSVELVRYQTEKMAQAAFDYGHESRPDL